MYRVEWIQSALDDMGIYGWHRIPHFGTTSIAQPTTSIKNSRAIPSRSANLATRVNGCVSQNHWVC